MRILHMLNHTRRLNGHVHAAVDLACAQVNLGHQVAVCSENGDFDELLKKNNVKTFYLSHQRKLTQVFLSVLQLYKLLKVWRPDILHAHMMTSAVLAWPICKILNIPLITTVHNEFEKSSILMGLGNRVITVSSAVGESMVRRGISSSKIDVVLNGTIGSVRNSNSHFVNIEMSHPAVIFVGGLHPRKGLPDLFEAFDIFYESNTSAHLYIVGDGPFLEKYKAIVGSLLCKDAVTFVGAVDNPYPWMAAADVFVLPSLADPAPLVLSEARNARCAIIGTQVDGIPELLEFGHAGILVPSNSPREIAKALEKIFRHPDDTEAWKIKSQFNLERLHISRVAGETMKVYDKSLL